MVSSFTFQLSESGVELSDFEESFSSFKLERGLSF